MSSPLRIEDLVNRFGSVTAVDGVSLEVKPGECFGLLGRNAFRGLHSSSVASLQVLHEKISS